MVIICFLLIVGGFYTAIYYGFYKWERPLSSQNYYLSLKRGGIWISAENNTEFANIFSALNKYSRNNNYIFVFDYQPMIYYLLEKNNPTKFDLIAYNNYFLSGIPEVISDIKSKRVNFIMTNKSILGDKNKVAIYIKKNYRMVGGSEHFYFWSKSGF